MTQDTSIEAFKAAQADGLISKRQMQIVEYMLAHGATTQREVQVQFNDLRSSFHPRFRELESNGTIVCTGKRVDTDTGRNVKVYQLVKVPTSKPSRKESKGAAARKLLKELLDDYSIGDYIYSIRECEGKGWDGPKVKRFSDLIEEARIL